MQRAVMYLVVGLGCAVAMPCAGEDTQSGYDPLILQSCLDSQDVSGWDRCVGMAATHCTYGPLGASTVGLGYCLDQEYQQWDGVLNRLYRELLELDATSDQQMGDAMPQVPRLEPSLRDMQRQWIGFRDAACLYELAHWGGGTGGGPALTRCMMEMTADRAIGLKTRVAEYEAWEEEGTP